MCGKTTDRICNFNRHYAEHAGYFESKTSFIEDARAAEAEINFYDSNTGNLLFTAPKGRTLEEFLVESRAHGWPSFRDEEVNWELVRCLPDGECVSLHGKCSGLFLMNSFAPRASHSLEATNDNVLPTVPAGTHLGHNLPGECFMRDSREGRLYDSYSTRSV